MTATKLAKYVGVSATVIRNTDINETYDTKSDKLFITADDNGVRKTPTPDTQQNNITMLI